MPERSDREKRVDLQALFQKSVKLTMATAESRDERASRLRREEAEDAHNQQINLLVHRSVIVAVAIAMTACVVVTFVQDPKTGLPDKAMTIITAIVAAGVGYVTGKARK